MSGLRAHAIGFRLSSIGYHTLGSKVAVLYDVPDKERVRVVLYDPQKRNSKFPVLLGEPVYPVKNVTEFATSSQGPSTNTYRIDFSGWKQPGTYELRIEGTNVKSPPIRINDYLFWDALKPVTRTFYFQRCGQEVEDTQLNITHEACHLNDALAPGGSASDDPVDVIGGWHNGSDYAKYTTATALSASRLMAMSEWDPRPFKFFRLDYPIFEADYGKTDDLHHEVLAGLNWLMVMQRRDGGVYRKVAGKQWPHDIRPEADEQPRYLYEVSTQDTAATAATFAIAARSFKTADLGYSVKSLLAAEKSWKFLLAHPSPIGVPTKADYSGSGEFIDPAHPSDMAYRVWAATELYVSTEKPEYRQFLLQHLREVPVAPYSWRNPALQGYLDYALAEATSDPETTRQLTGMIGATASAMAQAIDEKPYGDGLSQYGNASNLIVVERANLLMAAYRLTQKPEFLAAANRSLIYLYGVNAMGISFVTGSGEAAVKHPAHRWMSQMNTLIPGYLVDGPNEAPRDNLTPKGVGALSYVDDAKAYSSNESTILNNAGLAYLLATLNAAYNQADIDKANAPKKATDNNPLDYKLSPTHSGRRKKQ